MAGQKVFGGQMAEKVTPVFIGSAKLAEKLSASPGDLNSSEQGSLCCAGSVRPELV